MAFNRNSFKTIRKAVQDKRLPQGKYYRSGSSTFVEISSGRYTTVSPEEGLRKIIEWAQGALDILEEEDSHPLKEVDDEPE